MLQEMSTQGLPSRTPADTRWLLSYLLCQESHGLAELSAWVTGLCGRSGSAEIALGALTRHRAPGSGSGRVALGKGGGRVRNVGRAQRLGEASACLSVSPSLSLSLPLSVSVPLYFSFSLIQWLCDGNAASQAFPVGLVGGKLAEWPGRHRCGTHAQRGGAAR